MAQSLFKDKTKCFQFKSVLLLSYLNYHTSVWASALKCVRECLSWQCLHDVFLHKWYWIDNASDVLIVVALVKSQQFLMSSFCTTMLTRSTEVLVYQFYKERTEVQNYCDLTMVTQKVWCHEMVRHKKQVSLSFPVMRLSCKQCIHFSLNIYIFFLIQPFITS